jgi:hypothetical protein
VTTQAAWYVVSLTVLHRDGLGSMCRQADTRDLIPYHRTSATQPCSSRVTLSGVAGISSASSTKGPKTKRSRLYFGGYSRKSTERNRTRLERHPPLIPRLSCFPTDIAQDSKEAFFVALRRKGDVDLDNMHSSDATR